ncbi:hypothetical protein CTI14_41540, partial [Methylobacterium radiotolerans]
EKAYLTAQDNWQKAVDRVSELYVSAYQSKPFQLAAQHDYSATSWRSVERFIRMLSLWHNDSPMGHRVTYPDLDIAADATRRAKSKQAEAQKRLEQRYDEGARANFEKAYLTAQDNWQKAVDRVSELYVSAYQSKPFQL